MNIAEIIDKALEMPKTGYTAADLQTKDFPPIKYIVEGYIPEGGTIFAGRPKIGKSWACLDIAIAVASGGLCLGSVQCEQGAVLYLALEDNPRRLKSRLQKLLPAGEWPAALHFETSWPRLKEGGVDKIKVWADSNPTARLIIVDTLGKIRSSTNENESSFQADYDCVAELQTLSSQRGIGLIIVHHVRKMGADDPIDTVSGTLGLSGAADTILVLNRNGQGTTLYARGRDIEEIESSLNFDKRRCRWEIIGDADQHRKSGERKEIFDLLNEAGTPLRPKELGDALGKKPATIRQILSRMANAGDLQKLSHGKYALNNYVDKTTCHTSHDVTLDNYGIVEE